MASTRKRGVRYTGLFRDADGGQKSAGTYDTEKAALKAAEAAEALVSIGQDGTVMRQPKPELAQPATRRGQLTVAGFEPTWFEALTEHEPTTQETYTNLYRKHVKPAIGKAVWAEFDKAAVRRFMAALKDGGMTAATRGHVLTALRSMCRLAVDDGLLPADPTAGVKVKGRQAPEMRILTRAEYDRLLKVTDPHYVLLLRTLVMTGMRFGEAMGVQRGDITKRAGGGYFLRVRRTVIEVKGRLSVREYGKTVKATRSISISDDLGLALIERGLLDPDGFVFRAARGGQLSRSNVRRIWVKALKAAGLTGIRVHDLRHTHASWLLANGASLIEVRDRLGHTDIRTTSRYLHVVDGDEDSCLSAMDRAMSDPPRTGSSTALAA